MKYLTPEGTLKATDYKHFSCFTYS